jgi:acetylornithine deacetylase/succinyl-diaminopimelate desuccinylase-like protein
LVEILAKLHDDQGRITIPHFYDQVRKLTPAERTALAKVPYTEATLKAETGVSQPWGEADYTVLERIGARPTLEICGIVGGWTGEGGKTVIPQRALAKVSCRLVPDQDPDHILELLKKYVAALTPPTIRSEVRLVHPGSPGVVLEYDSQAMQTAAQAYEHIFGKKPVFIREGGSIHVVSDFVNHLKTPVILMGFGLPDDNLHAPNEKFTLSMFYRGIDTAIHFYEHLPAALR